MAAGVVLETLSWRKLSILIVILLIGQIISFLIGGLISPKPNTSSQILTEKCIDHDPIKNENKWFFSRKIYKNEINCVALPNDEFIPQKYQIGNNEQIVFSAHFPLPRDNIYHNMSKWFQQIIGILHLDISYQKNIEMKQDTILTMDVRLGYRNKGDHNWTQMARSLEQRPLHCTLDKDAETKQKFGEDIEGRYYDCDILPLFSLGSSYYDEYLLNIRLPSSLKTKYNKDFGQLNDLWVVEVHQNGGFTMVWFTMKTVMTLVTLTALAFFTNRIHQLDRPMNLLEQTIISLGIFMSFLNFPIEWLSLIFNLSFWLILSDIRQGAFYGMLLCFWVIFVGEHMLDDIQDLSPRATIKQRLYYYSPQLIPIGSASIFLFLFELSERGVQLINPFYSVWSHDSTSKLAICFIVLAVICAVVYFGFITYKIIQSIRQMFNKRNVIKTMPEKKQKFYNGIIYRFTIFIFYTLFCVCMTIVFFLFSQIDESQWKWGERQLEYTSAYITGVYGMWNIYVISILCLYAPSHKYKKKPPINNEQQSTTNSHGNNSSSNLLPTVSRGMNSSTLDDDLVVLYEKQQVGNQSEDRVALTRRIDIHNNSKSSQVPSTSRSTNKKVPVNNPMENLIHLNKPRHM